ncbi:MAG: hypothetical protein ACOCUV_01740 [bacterium]
MEKNIIEIIRKIKNSNFKTGYIHSLKQRMEKGEVLEDKELFAAARAFKKYEIYQNNAVEEDYPKSVDEMRKIRAERLKKFKENQKKSD